ncbi:MAG: flagellar basal body L-ring protein FlgH [Acidobacteria bacterium]|nr:flagellar basal body L-ring protein FlgH [Acidobacteriota bacterium]MCB9397411.1 flagellar basal body L-ring protein FlgH [Acidobacteriota bacterium]
MYKVYALLFSLALCFSCAIRDHGLIDPRMPPIVPLMDPGKPEGLNLSEGSLFSDYNSAAGLISDTRAYRLNEVVIINISESTTATNSATTSTERKNNTDLGISSFFGVETSEGPNINPNFNPSAMVGAKSESSHDGTGTTKRSGVFTGTIAARVIQVLPSGYLVVQGHKTVQVNGELGKIYLSGLVNPLMIGKDSSISSEKIADLQLIYSGAGIVGAQQRPGFMFRLLHAIWPF